MAVSAQCGHWALEWPADRRSLLPLAIVRSQTCDGRCTITTSNSIWTDWAPGCSVRRGASKAIKQGLPALSKERSELRNHWTSALTHHKTTWLNPKGKQTPGPLSRRTHGPTASNPFVTSGLPRRRRETAATDRLGNGHVCLSVQPSLAAPAPQ